MNHQSFLVSPGTKISLKNDFDPSFIAEFHEKADARKKLKAGIKELASYQDILYAQNTYASLLEKSAIKHRYF
ncbi:MAG: polyphosphate kinase 2 family protein, partial [Sphaerospermopsis sp. SIO1G2]|nr:polyphosphate kinase 2 family protein [Sphaerospermopsis sp. SIO1G2]